jgi:hypothetical protein
MVVIYYLVVLILAWIEPKILFAVNQKRITIHQISVYGVTYENKPIKCYIGATGYLYFGKPVNLKFLILNTNKDVFIKIPVEKPISEGLSIGISIDSRDSSGSAITEVDTYFFTESLKEDCENKLIICEPIYNPIFFRGSISDYYALNRRLWDYYVCK